jgi:peptide/nickel transport system ATP-binding protein
MSLLEIRDLSVAIDGKQLLKSLRVDLCAGQILGLVGESGSGKSLMALAIMGLLPSRARVTGRVYLADTDLTDCSEAELCRLRGCDVGMIFQEPMSALNPLLSIGEQVAETVSVHRRASRQEALRFARQTLDRVGLPEPDFPLSLYPHQLSGGQRQRVAIAIAIALTPRLLIADEPTTALDVTTQAQILSLLQRLVREDGIGLILVSHDLAVVAQLADRVAVMKDGEIVEQGTTDLLLCCPRHPYLRALLANSRHRPRRTTQPNTAQAKPILEVEQVVREYRRSGRGGIGDDSAFRAVDGVSLNIRPGENVGLVGESGCGKSTLLRAILGLQAIQGGEIRVHGVSLARARGKQLRRLRQQIQVVFQDPWGSFDPRWRVEQLVAESFHLLDSPPGKREARRKVEQVLERVGLAPADADRYPHEFSGGQRQRIAIARALVTEPSIIALDEAVSALDVTIRAQILDLLADLSQSLSCLFVSHDLEVVRSITDRIYVMHEGRIVESGPTETVLDFPRHPYTASLAAATPRLEATLHERDASPEPGLRSSRLEAVPSWSGIDIRLEPNLSLLAGE